MSSPPTEKSTATVRVTTGDEHAAVARRDGEWCERIPVPCWVTELRSLRILDCNEEACAMYGHSRDEFLHMRMTDLLATEERPAFQEYTAALLSQEVLERRGVEPNPGRAGGSARHWTHRTKDGIARQVELASKRIEDDEQGRPRALILSNDITERLRQEKRTAIFTELGQGLSCGRTPRQAAENIASAADALFGWDACLFELFSRDRQAVTKVLCVDTIDGRRTEVRATTGQPEPIVREVLRSGPRLLLRDASSKFPPGSVPFGDTSRPSLSIMSVPVRYDERPLAILSVHSYRESAYTQEDLKVLETLAEHCGAALERIRAEEEIARLHGEVRGHIEELATTESEVVRLNAELEKRVRDRTMQLEAINRELEAFSYSVSHDLRAPLRSIRGFSEVLMERYLESLDARGQDFLRRVCESCAQMDKLIDDLLKLSRVGRSEMSRAEVDLSALAHSVIADLKSRDPGRPVRFVVAPGLRAWGDGPLLRLALDNLLRNAWKFTRDQPEPVIEFGMTDEPEPAFFVRDNGAGFDMAYVNKLFGVFQRLHTTSEFPGTGVGLATVQRIVSRHGGRVCAKGAVNQGATFYFTLPTDAEI